MERMRKQTTDLAKALRAALAAADMSRFELSKRSGVSYSVIHRFFGGDRDLTLRTASKLADVLGLELRPVRRGKRKGR